MKELKDMEKQNPFKVPEGYFEELPARIITATSGIVPGEVKKSKIYRLRLYLAVAATVAVMAIIGLTALYLSSSGRKNQIPVDFTITELNRNYINDIDLFTLEEKVADTDPFERAPEVSSNEIIDYLISENINILDIYEQL
jgi:hypothetical protein